MMKYLLQFQRCASFNKISQCRHFVSEAKYNPKEVQIPVPWGHVSGKFWNSLNTSRQPILALHGWLDNAATYDRLIPLLSPNLPILAIDLPGHGKSSHLPKGMNYDVLKSVYTLKKIIDFYGLENVSLMGHSLGGIVSFVYSVMYNDKVNKLVLLDILTPIPRKDTYISQGGEAIDKFLKNAALEADTAPSYSFDELTKAVVKSQNGGLTEETARILLKRGTIRTSDNMYRLSRDVRLKAGASSGFLWSEKNVMEFCLNMRANILCIKAESSSYYFKKEIFYSFWETIEKSARGATLKVVPGKHHVHLEEPQNVASLVNEFLIKT